MSNRTEIRDRLNRYIGWLDDDGDMIRAYHVRLGYLGYFNRSANKTFEKNGRIYCYGNGASDLVREAERKS